MDTTSRKLELAFAKKEQLTRDTFTFFFDRSKEQFDFHAGQYFRLTIPIENPDERGTSRYFTISSSPTDLDFLTITTKVIRSSFKLKLNSFQGGEKIIFFGPFGNMYQDENDQTPKVFLAGGIGLTPSHSILRFIDHQHLNVNFTLIVSFPFRNEVVFYDELKEIEKRNPAVKIVYTLTKEETLYPEFEKGRIDENMIKKYVQDYQHYKFFVVGPPLMAEAMFTLAISMGVEEGNITRENFTGY